ncbi:MAG: cytochrome c biogenesis protein CcdA [Nitrospirota bacterium]
MATQEVTFSLAFVFGLLSFASPCVLPLIPSYLSYITGLSFADLTGEEDKKRIQKVTIVNSAFFILGFSLVFIGLGASASFIGSFLLEYKDTMRIAGGILIIIFGLYVLGIIKIGFLIRERRLHLKERPLGYIGSLLIGITFAAGWTPCIGPMLGTILMLASQAESMSYGIQLLTVYSLGLGIPFFLSSLALSVFLSYSRKVQRYMRIINIVSGILLIIVGFLFLTDNFQVLSGYLVEWTKYSGI